MIVYFNYVILIVILTVSNGVNTANENKLILLQVVWRHGDRTPLKTCAGDPNQESAWPQGWGQLTQRGMKQHVELGKMISERYSNFLSSHYDSKQLYVRSTDLNRTLMSAMSNFIGFYHNQTLLQPGINYPNISEWPTGYIPVPIHTVNNKKDHLCNPDADCPRLHWLKKFIRKTPQYLKLDEDSKSMLAAVSTACKHTISLHRLFDIQDAFYIDNLYNLSIPVNNSLFQQMMQTEKARDRYEDGSSLNSTFGINFQVEIAKIRGGTLLWDIIRHIDLKLYCLNAANQKSSHCTWMNNLKYYIYSAHDSTIDALLTAMKARQEVLYNGGYPDYSSAVFIELYDTPNGHAFKMLYHRNFSSTVEDITKDINSCDKLDKSGLCSFSTFRTASRTFYPGDITTLCENTKSKSTSFDPDHPTKAASHSFSIISAMTLIMLLQQLVFN